MISADMMNVIELDELREKVERLERIEKATRAFVKEMEDGYLMKIIGNGMSNDEGEVDRLEGLYEAMKKAVRSRK